MEAVGQLTGGVAHDFNNLLTVIIGNLDSCRAAMLGEDGRPRVLRALGNALERRRARRGAHPAPARLLAPPAARCRKPIDVNRLVAGMSELLHRTLGETIEVETVLAAGLWRIEADPNQLENAILNLAVNARDAMPEGGKLTIETANAHLDETMPREHADVLARPVRADRGHRHRHRHGAGHAGARLRALLHHQGGRQGHRPRPRHGLRLRQAVGRPREDL